MKSTLRDFYYGRIIPWERRGAHNAELETLGKIEDEERYFLQKLPPDDCQRFQALMGLCTQMDTTEEEDVFAYGFALGVLLMADVMREAELIVHE